MRTRPSSSSADAARYRDVLMLLICVQPPSAASKTSTPSRYGPESPTPPATITRPSASGIVSKKYRGTWAMSTVGLQVPEAGLKISAPGKSAVPPTASTRPSCRVAMPRAYRAVDSGGTADQVPVDGLKISADDRWSVPLFPPATRTLPSERSADPARKRGEVIFPVDGDNGDHLFVCGS